MGDTLRLRGEAAVGFWHFNGYPQRRHRRQRHAPAPADGQRPAQPEPAQPELGAWPDTRGGGAGVYLYRFPSRPNGGAWGIHGVAGVEYLLPTMRSRWLAGGEVQLHVMGQPKAPGDVAAIPMLSAHVSAVLKYRLP